MDIALWIVQGLLALAFLMAGIMKATQPREKLLTNMKYVEDFSQNTIRGIGALEFLAAIGLILPMLLNILPILTPLAALGLVMTMIGAIFTHIRRKEYPQISINVILLLMAAFVVYGRLVSLPVA